eukprot:TRINITY_DN7789_c0_g1_i2.p2 TRINITY_DN7789_c0_g1~~TRINITY_DN7789_c0_g1_i2.p2  ORF type:complete len:212 (-),score=60.09 TRINITY_DN7789_c0_g1_i2:406-1041(-)
MDAKAGFIRKTTDLEKKAMAGKFRPQQLVFAMADLLSELPIEYRATLREICSMLNEACKPCHTKTNKMSPDKFALEIFHNLKVTSVLIEHYSLVFTEDELEQKQLEQQEKLQRIARSEMLKLKMFAPTPCEIKCRALATVKTLLAKAAVKLGLEPRDGELLMLKLEFSEEVIVDQSMTLLAAGLGQEGGFEVLGDVDTIRRAKPMSTAFQH